jgi:hypothetical protein
VIIMVMTYEDLVNEFARHGWVIPKPAGFILAEERLYLSQEHAKKLAELAAGMPEVCLGTPGTNGQSDPNCNYAGGGGGGGRAREPVTNNYAGGGGGGRAREPVTNPEKTNEWGDIL